MNINPIDKTPNIEIIDLFCGIGGLSHGFLRESMPVLAGIDIDSSCSYAYQTNNHAKFIHRDISDIPSSEIIDLYSEHSIKIIVGCAPCQPFSSYNFKTKGDKKWHLLGEFSRIINDVQPDIISMENVPQLLSFKKENVFESFLNILRENNYFVDYKIVDCSRYGIPQKRKRLVLIASKLGAIKIIPETHTKETVRTVRQAIGALPPINHGEKAKSDDLHKSAKLTTINLNRIRQSKQGGSWKDWDESLLLNCHKKDSGKTYVSVYGRMKWDEPSPTITTQFIGIGNGRFGHPEQDRAISIREAALLQTFPIDYQFSPNPDNTPTKQIATHIGNAVPVLLGQVIAKSIKKHLIEHRYVKEKNK